MKKFIALLLAEFLMFSLTSCASGTSSGNENSSQSSTSADKGETVTVKITVPTMNNLPSDEASQKVSDAISKYIQGKGYNIAVKLEPYTLTDYTTNMNMRLAGGEKLDIFYTGPLNTAVSNGYMTKLDKYKDNTLKGAMDVIGDWYVCGMVNGSLYGLPAYKGVSLDYKYIYNEEYFKDFDMSAIKSVDDLDGLFTEFKKKYPKEYPAVNTYNTSLALYCEQDHTATVGTYFATVGDSTTLVNLFDTAAFKKAVEKAYEWRKLGYVDPEGSAQTLGHDALTYSGYAKGVVMGHSYSIDTIEKMFTMNNTYGATFKAVSICDSSLTSNELTYGIAYTSEHPDAAAQVLNLLWTDDFVMSSIIYGVEGVSWEWNSDKSSIVYPDGLGLDSVPYTCLYTCGAFGNQFLLYPMDGNTSEADKKYMKSLNDNAWVAPLFGFTPSSDKVASQVAAVSNVYNKYAKSLLYGDINPDKYLPEFLSALKDAGINDIMDNYQSQINDWVAKYK
jgi:putative aldouronate transport system substrate-binding protein